MADLFVPDEIREFILKQIDSVAQIEALLLIRSNSAERWTASQIAARLYIDEVDAADALERLCAAGLLVFIEGAYGFDGLSAENALLIGKLAAIYTRQLIPVTNLIHSKPRRIRSFADAFRFRKDS
jgi:hypothetical protein